MKYSSSSVSAPGRQLSSQLSQTASALTQAASNITQNSASRGTILSRIKDPGSAITHFIGMIAALAAAFPLLILASRQTGYTALIAMSIFIISMVLLYAASAAYHTFDISERANRVLRKIDHMMIFILIAGSYTPICLLVLPGRTGLILLSIVWGIALIGILVKAFWITCPKWFSSLLYIGMGWTCVLAFGQIIKAMTTAQFLWLLVGGIIYTIGGIIYALKLSLFNAKHRHFGSHEIFHLFVMGGSFCHFVVMYLLV